MTNLPPTEPTSPPRITDQTPPPHKRPEILTEVKHPQEWTTGDMIRAAVGLTVILIAAWILVAILT